MPELSNPTVVALLLGYALGAALAVMTLKTLTKRIASRLSIAFATSTVRRAALLGMFVGALPSAIGAFIVGGNVGLDVASALRGGPVAEQLGIGAGVLVVMFVALVACAIAGGLAGGWMASSRGRGEPNERRRVGRGGVAPV